MNLVKTLKYFHIDSICYFIALLGSFMSLVLIEIEAGKFLASPFLICTAISCSLLSIMHCCENEECSDLTTHSLTDQL